MYEKLRKIDVSKHVKKKGNLDYLPWAYAWDYLIQNAEAPVEYHVRKFGESHEPWLRTANGGMVYVQVSVGETTRKVWLPIMDHRNNAILAEKITARDINDTIQRALVKAIAMHGLGINLYMGEEFKEEKSGSVKAVIHEDVRCPDCDSAMALVPAGTSKKTGKPYPEFYSCSSRDCHKTMRTDEVVHPEITSDDIPF